MRLPTALTLHTPQRIPRPTPTACRHLAVTLPIPTGVFGLFGPNGAGKSRILATLQEPDRGSVRFGDTDETVSS